MRRIILGLCVPLLFAANYAPQGQESGLEKLAQTPSLALHELQANPNAYLGARAHIVVYFGEAKEPANPFFTRFNSSLYSRFSAWDATQSLAADAALENEFAYLFAAKNSSLCTVLKQVKKYAEVELTVIIRDTTHNHPWLEVVYARATGHWVPEGSLIAIARARRLYNDGRNHMAIEMLQKAIVDIMPVREKANLLEEIATIHIENKDFAQAREALQQALTLEPTRESIQQKIASLP